MSGGGSPTVRWMLAGRTTQAATEVIQQGRLARVRTRIAFAVPDVGEAGDDRQRPPLAAATDEERQVALERGRIGASSTRGEPGALDVRSLSVQQQPTDARRFVEPVEPLGNRRVGVPEGAMLGGMPAGPETEDGSPSAGVVERRGHAHEERRVPVGERPRRGSPG